MVSVDNDEIIIHIFQYAWGIRSDELKFIDRSAISILIENDPIVSPLPRQYRIQQRFLFEHLLKFKLFMRLLSPPQQDPHMLAESTQIFIKGVKHRQLFVKTPAKRKRYRKALKTGLWSVQ